MEEEDDVASPSCAILEREVDIDSEVEVVVEVEGGGEVEVDSEVEVEVGGGTPPNAHTKLDFPLPCAPITATLIVSLLAGLFIYNM